MINENIVSTDANMGIEVRLRTFDEFRSSLETCRNSPATLFTSGKRLVEHGILDTSSYPLTHQK